MPQSLNSETLAQIIDGSSISSFVLNNEHIVIHWNKAIEVLTGVSRDKVVGTDEQWKAFYPSKRPCLSDLVVDNASIEEIRLHYGKKVKKSSLTDDAYEVEDYFPSLNGTGKWLYFTASPIRRNDGTVIGSIETIKDITKHKAAEENLHHYLKEITKAQEEERKRIARELHDDTTQVLGSISRQLDNFIRKNPNLAPNDMLFLKNIQEQINHGVHDLQRFCQGLRLSILDDLGLIPALRSLVKSLQESQKIHAELQVVGEVKRFPPEIESTLFHIVQEAINNIKKHAQASEAKVIIRFLKKGIDISISDNGQGFELKARIDEFPREGKLGLTGIEERVQLLGGTLEVSTAPGKGTTLDIHLDC